MPTWRRNAQARAGQGDGAELPAQSNGAQPCDRTKLPGWNHRAHASSSVLRGGSGGAFLHLEGGRICRMISSSLENPAIEEAAIEQLLAHRLDGLIVASCNSSPENSSNSRSRKFHLFSLIVTSRIQDQFCRRRRRRRGADCNGTSDRNGLQADRAHSWPGVYHRTGQVRRIQTGSQAARNEFRSQPSESLRDRGWKGLATKLRRHAKFAPANRPDGVFCYNDPIAYAAIEVALGAGLGIPEDIAFVGCDNLHFDTTLRAPLTSVDHHSSLVGVRAAKMLLSLLKNKTSRSPRHVALKPSLVVRQSSLHNGPGLAQT